MIYETISLAIAALAAIRYYLAKNQFERQITWAYLCIGLWRFIAGILPELPVGIFTPGHYNEVNASIFIAVIVGAILTLILINYLDKFRVQHGRILCDFCSNKSIEVCTRCNKELCVEHVLKVVKNYQDFIICAECREA